MYGTGYHMHITWASHACADFASCMLITCISHALSHASPRTNMLITCMSNAHHYTKHLLSLGSSWSWSGCGLGGWGLSWRWLLLTRWGLLGVTTFRSKDQCSVYQNRVIEMCMCVNMYVCTCCMYICICMYMCMHVCVLYMYVSVCV